MSLRAIGLMLIGLGGVAWVAWQWAYEPPVANARSAAAEHWQLSPRPMLAPQSALKFLQSADRWGNLAKLQADQAQSEPTWGFTGVMGKGRERYVMLSVQGQPERPVTVGDPLPNGSAILEIGPDSVCILINGKKRTLPVLNTWASRSND